ncbi:hypothetical protein [Halalkalicoccus salilacus]|uniref:hypothetical protein n=1 Tax=Halalkalicoccus salilacus TaxID=3117459 RepID=UPI00300F1572
MRSVGKQILQTKILPVLIVIVGLIGCFLSIWLTNPYTLVIPPIVVAAAILHLITRKRADFHLRKSFRAKPLLVLLFVLFILTLFFYYKSGQERTLLVHIFTLGLYVLILLLIRSDLPDILTFSTLIGVGIFHRAMISYASAIQMGIDSLFHIRVAQLIASEGTIAPLATSQYWYAPFYHILTAAGMQILDVSPRNTAFITIGISLLIAPSLLIYSITTFYWSREIALLSVFLFVISDFVIAWSVQPVTTTLGTVFFITVIYLFINIVNNNGKRYFLLIVLSSAALMWTHQFTFFITVLSVTVISIVHLTLSEDSVISFTRISTLLSSLLIFDWMVTSFGGPNGQYSFLQVLVGLRLLNQLSNSGARNAVLPNFENLVLSGADALTPEHILGFGLLIGLGILGGLTWTQKEEDESVIVAFSLGAVLATFLGFSFAGPLIGINFLLADRWFVFIYAIICIFAAVGVYRLVTSLSISSHSTFTIFLILCVLPIVIFMSFNYMGAMDDPVFDSPGAERFAMSNAERSTYTWAAQFHGDNIIIGDFLAATIIDRHYEAESDTYRYSSNGSNLHNSSDQIYIYRKYMASESNSYYIRHNSRTFRVHGPISRPAGKLIYDSGEAQLIAGNSESTQIDYIDYE